ncbi:hypothetical protein [Cerasicoccus maritimus]|uniref:hypothetical protein n=1 Tax=Cerasicoccus maritimus TaxID=490089 RepID=UPI002852A3DE|nr:hypothetical protein [Cerasicoccus maritimus]
MSLIKNHPANRPNTYTSEGAHQQASAKAPLQTKNNSGLNRQLKYLIWLYVFLLLFDGAFRKWFLPGLSDVLLVSRVPVIALIYILAIPARAFTVNGFVAMAGFLSLVTLPLALLGHGSIPTAIYGLLANFYAIPLIFVIPKVLDYDETLQIGKALLIMVIPMTALISLQFYAPQSAWVNRSVGGVEGAGFTGALGRFRPPGTFSFISGVAQFYTLAFAFFLNEFINKRSLPLWFLLPTGAAFTMAIYGSISRLLALSIVMVFAFGVLGLVLNGRKLHNTIKVLIALIVFFAIASQFTYFADGMETFMARWEQAKGGEDGSTKEAVVDRTLDNIMAPFFIYQYDSIIGEGIGLGTNVGAKFATGSRAFLGGESEWGRVLVEMGPIIGITYIALRCALTAMLLIRAFWSLKKGNLLPWLLFASCLFLVLNGQWGQQTTLGFAILSAGFVLSTSIVSKPEETMNNYRARRP